MIQYKGAVTVDGHTFNLPPGFKAYFLRINRNKWDKSKPSFITDRYGNDCDFRVINGQPCLISIRGVVEV